VSSDTKKGRGAGRPHLTPDQRRTTIVRIYMTEDEFAEVRRVTAKERTSESDFGRQAMLAMARMRRGA